MAHTNLLPVRCCISVLGLGNGMMNTEMLLQAAELGLHQSHHNFSADRKQLRLAPKKDMIGFPRDQFAGGFIDDLPTEKFV